MTTTFKDKAVSGVKWSAISQFGTQGVIMASSIILARLLSPGEFGLMAMLTVFVGFAHYFSSFGFGTALIQQKEVSEVELSSVFWINLGLGVLLTLIFALLSPLVADFYNEPSLKYLTIAVSINFALSALTGVHIAILNRQLAFKQLSITTFLSILLSYSIAIICAGQGLGVWSLLVQSIVNTLALTCFYLYFCKWKPKFIYSKEAISRLSKVGGHIFFINIFDYIATNVDTVLIGKYISKKQLGEYGRSNAFTMLPVSNVSTVLARVLMPSLAQIQDDKRRVADIYLRTARVLAFIIFPMMIGLALVAEPFVEIVFGEEWIGMVPMLQWFAPLGILASFNSIHDPIIVSQGRTDLLFKLAPFEKGLLIVAVFSGLYWGVFGIIICKGISNILISLPKFWVLSKSINVDLSSIYTNLLSTFIVTSIMGIAVWVIQKLLPQTMLNYWVLIISILGGVMVYISGTYIINYQVLLQIRSLIKR